MTLFDPQYNVLERALDLRLARQSVLQGNLANANTPNFLARDLDFTASLAQTLRRDQAEGGRGSGPVALVETASSASRAGLDGNSVEVDRTLAQLAQNGLLYAATAKAVGKKLSILRAIADGGA